MNYINDVSMVVVSENTVFNYKAIYTFTLGAYKRLNMDEDKLKNLSMHSSAIFVPDTSDDKAQIRKVNSISMGEFVLCSALKTQGLEEAFCLEIRKSISATSDEDASTQASNIKLALEILSLKKDLGILTQGEAVFSEKPPEGIPYSGDVRHLGLLIQSLDKKIDLYGGASVCVIDKTTDASDFLKEFIEIFNQLKLSVSMQAQASKLMPKFQLLNASYNDQNLPIKFLLAIAAIDSLFDEKLKRKLKKTLSNKGMKDFIRVALNKIDQLITNKSSSDYLDAKKLDLALFDAAWEKRNEMMHDGHGWNSITQDDVNYIYSIAKVLTLYELDLCAIGQL